MLEVIADTNFWMPGKKYFYSVSTTVVCRSVHLKLSSVADR